jgi:hypothetical protein
MTGSRLKLVGGLLFTLLAVALIVNQYVNNVVAEFYSPGFRSESSADAFRRGVLIRRLRVVDTVLPGAPAPYRVSEAWIEDRQQIYYRLLFFRRDSLLHRPYVIARLDPSAGSRCIRPDRLRIRLDSGTELTSSSCTEFLAEIAAPYPDSIRLRVTPP